MKDIIALTIAGTLFWIVTIYPEDCFADVLFENNVAWVLLTVTSF